MRCPYCGNFNPDKASFCAKCGRDITPEALAVRFPPVERQMSPNQAWQGAPQPAPQNIPAGRRPVAPVPHPTPQPAPKNIPAGRRPVNPVAQPLPPPEPPAPFPPRTLEQLQALQAGALEYKVLSEDMSDGRKRIVRISFQKCI